MAPIGNLVDLIGQPVQQVPIIGFVGNLFLVTVMSYVLSYVYVARGKALSNRRSLSSNFFLISVTTMFIITVVKSSLALSLGLVGALSIVRFRTAIKEPEELAYLFLTIAVGLGLGADQTVVTIVVFVFIIFAILIRDMFKVNGDGAHMYLSIKGIRDTRTSFEKILSIVKQYCDTVDLKRYDETSDKFEAMLVVDFTDSGKLLVCTDKLRSLDKSLVLKVIDSRTY